jgi:type III pantothenate kinase
LPRIAIEVPAGDSVIGRTTESQMLVGVYWGYVALIEGLVTRLKAEIGRPAKVIATGGLAILFDKNIDAFDSIEPDLTIQGLALLAAKAIK